MSTETRNVAYDPDLAWYFSGDAKGDMGLKAAPLQPSHTGGGPSTGISREQSAAVQRYNRIGLVLGDMPEREVRLLELAHRDVPPGLRPRFARLGTLAYVVMDMAESPEWVVEHLASKEVTQLLSKARTKVAKAVAKFQAADREWQALERKAGAERKVRRALG